jgi:predicted Zn-ribbon and HTH transcriptional regulator
MIPPRGTPTAIDLRADPALKRAREAGGPIDRASYTCSCGYLFSAQVSTTVRCPHCGAGQAW